MKCRVTEFDRLSKAGKDTVYQVAHDMAAESYKEHAENHLRLHKAMFCDILHDKFGFGAQRLNAVLDEFNKCIELIQQQYDGDIEDYAYKVENYVEKLGVKL